MFKSRYPWLGLSLALMTAVMVGCGKKPADPTGDTPGSGGEVPSFTLAWSEYPSWSVFGVAHEVGLINGKQGEMGEIEKKYGVDIVLKLADYDSCLTMFGSNNCDAVCITNMDILNPSLSRKSVAILPTSTSDGADALIVTSQIDDIKNLKGKKIYGLAKSVSEYCFARNLELLGEKEEDYTFTNMDPGAAATAMQQKQADFDGIVVWNPFVLETLNKREDTKVLFDSSKIPGEIIDMLVVGNDSLAKPKGKEFAAALAATFYALNKRLADEKTHDETLVALGEKFSNLKLDSMKKVVEQTKFYDTPQAGLTVFEGAELKDIMKKVIVFCKSHEMVTEEPQVGYGSEDAGAHLRFDPSFMKNVK